MSNLLNSPVGILALNEATIDILRMRIRRWFERNCVIGFESWVVAGKPAFTADDALSILDNLNSAHDTEIINLLDALRRLESQRGDFNLNFYVDVAAGDDDAGDGSQTNPFASITKVQNLLGNYINGKINIFLDAPAASPLTDIACWNLELGPNAQVTIQGTNPVDVAAGPYAVNAWANLGVFNAGHSLQVAAPGWVIDAYQGYFVQATSGLYSGHYYAIAENSADTLYIAYTDKPMSAGDTFQIVRPGTHIQPPASDINISLNNDCNYLSDTDEKFVMTGISWAGSGIIQFEAQKCGILLGFCYFSSQCRFTNSYNMTINLCSPYDPTEILDQNAIVDTPTVYAGTWVFESLGWFTATHITGNQFTLYAGVIDIIKSAVGTVNGASQTKTLLNYILFRTNDDAIEYLTHSLQCVNFYCLGLTNSFAQLNDNDAWLRIGNGQCAALPPYALRVGVMGHVWVEGATMFGGSVNDIWWTVTAAAAAYPIAGAGATDGAGAWVTRT